VRRSGNETTVDGCTSVRARSIAASARAVEQYGGIESGREGSCEAAVEGNGRELTRRLTCNDPRRHRRRNARAACQNST
jgi:hypothetical protein